MELTTVLVLSKLELTTVIVVTFSLQLANALFYLGTILTSSERTEERMM